MEKKNTPKINPEKCKHLDWSVTARFKLSSGSAAQERTCNTCKLKIFV